MYEDFIVDWPVTEAPPLSPSLVTVRLGGRKAGLYRVKQVGLEGIVLSQGAISFPVGTQLEIEEIQHLAPGTFKNMKVVANNPQGLSLAW